jgi:type IV secretion system protein VirD4
MLVCQSLNQLFAKYGERNSILDNCKRKAILGCGAPSDAKLISDFLGSYSVNRKTVSQSGTLGNIIARTRSTSFMETEKKLMPVDEILRLPYQDFLLITDGELPYRGKKLMYYQDKRFEDRANLATIKSFNDQLRELPERPLKIEWLKDFIELQKLKAAWAKLQAKKLLPAGETQAQTAGPSQSASVLDQEPQDTSLSEREGLTSNKCEDPDDVPFHKF